MKDTLYIDWIIKVHIHGRQRYVKFEDSDTNISGATDTNVWNIDVK